MSGNPENPEMLIAASEAIATDSSYPVAVEITEASAQASKLESGIIAKVQSSDRVAISQAYARILRNGGHLSC